MNNNGNNEDNGNNAEEIEIINIGREGMSYGELKRLHNISMVALNNMSKIIPSLPTSTPTTPITLFSSKDVKISKINNNWLIPYLPFKECCHICRYFGHSLKNCPNIKQEYRGVNYCLNCWESGHSSGDCNGNTKVPPYNENFLSPEEIVNFLFYK